MVDKYIRFIYQEIEYSLREAFLGTEELENSHEMQIQNRKSKHQRSAEPTSNTSWKTILTRKCIFSMGLKFKIMSESHRTITLEL